MKFVLTINFEVDGDKPTEEEQRDIVLKALREWPTFVYTYEQGDEHLGALIVKEMEAGFETDQPAS